ncbi:MAG: phosphoheptose isomerase [Deltaproteobacteria bacterium]|nr:MAG: phosphoheptose isomerase [Deltaproteobacteria bacterium]
MHEERLIYSVLEESINIKKEFVEKNIENIISLAKKIAEAFSKDNKLLLCGNGGSAADAQHIAAEFVNRFILERTPLPAIALTTDTSIITSIANDYSFEHVFSKQIKAIGRSGDIMLAISTSGNSENVIQAVNTAKDMGIYTAALTGGDGGRLAKIVDIPIIVASNSVPRVQEVHIMAGHIICQLVDYILFEKE